MRKKFMTMCMLSLCAMTLWGCDGKDKDKKSSKDDTTIEASVSGTENKEENIGEDMTATEEIVVTEEVVDVQDENEYLSDIFVSKERKIWYLTYGNAKDSSVDKIFIAENGYLICADSDYTLGDVSKMTDDEIYNEIMTKISNLEIPYNKYDAGKIKLVCKTDSTGNRVTDENLLVTEDALVSFYLGIPTAIDLPFHVNTGAGPNPGYEVQFYSATVYEKNYQFYYFGKKYLMSALEEGETPITYKTDDFDESKSGDLIMDVESKKLYNSCDLFDGTYYGFVTPEGDKYIFENATLVNSHYYFPEGNAIVPYGSNTNGTDDTSDGNNAVYAPEGNSGSSFDEDLDGNGIIDRFEGNAGSM